jgi:hypothetical protein
MKRLILLLLLLLIPISPALADAVADAANALAEKYAEGVAEFERHLDDRTLDLRLKTAQDHLDEAQKLLETMRQALALAPKSSATHAKTKPKKDEMALLKKLGDQQQST